MSEADQGMSEAAIRAISWGRHIIEGRPGDAVRRDVWLFGLTPLGPFIILVESPLTAEIRQSPLKDVPRRVFDGPGAERACVEFVNGWYAAKVRACLVGPANSA